MLKATTVSLNRLPRVSFEHRFVRHVGYFVGKDWSALGSEGIQESSDLTTQQKPWERGRGL